MNHDDHLFIEDDLPDADEIKRALDYEWLPHSRGLVLVQHARRQEAELARLRAELAAFAPLAEAAVAYGDSQSGPVQNFYYCRGRLMTVAEAYAEHARAQAQDGAAAGAATREGMC